MELTKGIKAKSCDFLDLYSNISGRIGPLMPLEDNRMDELRIQGQDSAGIRKVVLTPSSPLDKMLKSDILCVPWGVRPNDWVQPDVPNGLSKYLFIQTPAGPERLEWDGTKFQGSSIIIQEVADEWCITGAVSYCFPLTTVSFACQPFPEGYSFLKKTGPTAFFEILRVDSHVDDHGRLAFYTLQVDSLKNKGYYIQE